MKKYFTKSFVLALAIIIITALQNVYAQTCEWRLITGSYSNTDPDDAGPALGSATFKLQIRTTGGNIPNITGISLGFAYNTASTMIPTGSSGPGCVQTGAPANIVLGPDFLAGSFSVQLTNQCNTVNQTAGGQPLNRVASGSIFASNVTGVTLTPSWMDVYTVTLWTLSNSYPQGGYVALNSSNGGAPNPIPNFEISDVDGIAYPANSLSFNSPLPLGATLPVLFSQFEAKCSNNGTAISWSTEQEANSAYFELERSINGTTWKTLGRTPAAGNSAGTRKYNQLDLEAGNAMYRVKQVDKDGQFIYTNIERANCQVKNVSAVIYPVPATDVLNVVIKSDKAIRTQLMVFEISGKLVKRLDANVQNGTNNFSIDLKGLTSGDYILKSSDAGIELNKQFTIIK